MSSRNLRWLTLLFGVGASVFFAFTAIPHPIEWLSGWMVGASLFGLAGDLFTKPKEMK